MKKKLTKNQITLVRIIVSAVLFVAVLLITKLVPMNKYVGLALYLAVYAVIGYDVLWRAIKNISHGQIFDENFLMCVATVGAFAIGEYMEAVAVMLFYQTGELFQCKRRGQRIKRFYKYERCLARCCR